MVLDNNSHQDCSQLTVSYSQALGGVSLVIVKQRREKRIQTPCWLAAPLPRNPNPPIALADCEIALSAMNHFKTSHKMTSRVSNKLDFIRVGWTWEQKYL